MNLKDITTTIAESGVILYVVVWIVVLAVILTQNLTDAQRASLLIYAITPWSLLFSSVLYMISYIQ